MRVLMFGWEFPPHVAGGLATATHGLVKGLLRNGVDVTLVVPFPSGQATGLPELRIVGVGDELADRLITHRIEARLDPYGHGYGEGVLEQRTWRSGRRDIRPLYGDKLHAEVERFADIATEIAADEPHDVIDAHDWITFAAGLAARRVSGRPLVAHIHATELDRLGEGASGEICEREIAGMTQAELVIANSNAIKKTCVSRYGIDASKVRVIHWGIDPERLPEPASSASPLEVGATGRRPPTVLFLGRVTLQKGPDYFVEVAARVAESIPEARFILAGSGDMLPQVIERSAELGYGDRIFFTGGVGGEDVTRLYRIADVCVMPSVSEPFGLVALESISQGTPCIVPRTSGVAEVLENVFKVDFWDLEQMTSLVVSLLRDAGLHDTMRDAALAELAQPRFGLDEPARQTAEVYAEAIGLRVAV